MLCPGVARASAFWSSENCVNSETGALHLRPSSEVLAQTQVLKAAAGELEKRFSVGLFSKIGPGDEIVLDGEDLRYFLKSFGKDSEPVSEDLLARFVEARLRPTQELLMISIRFDRSFILDLGSSRVDPCMVYGVEFPEMIQLSIRLSDGRLSLRTLKIPNTDDSSLKLLAHIPFLPDTVWFRRGKADLFDGRFEVRVGVLWNLIPYTVEGNLSEIFQ